MDWDGHTPKGGWTHGPCPPGRVSVPVPLDGGLPARGVRWTSLVAARSACGVHMRCMGRAGQDAVLVGIMLFN